MTSTPENQLPIVTGLMRWCGALAVLAVLAPSNLQAEGLNEHQKEMVKHGTEHLKSFLSHPQAEALRNLLGAARGVLIVPSSHKGGFLIGYERGNGMLLARHGEQWSDFVAMRLSNLSVGVQAGFKSSSMVMFIMTKTALDELIAGVDQYGGGGGFAIGSLGMSSTGAGGLKGGLEVLIVSTAEGAFVGGGFTDVNIELAMDVNKAVYGPDFDVKETLASTEDKLPEFDEMRKILTDSVHASWWEGSKAKPK
jgi:lipid-binding SYLF domain-containing protein